MTSETTIPSLFDNYVSPQRQYYPPSDIESEMEESYQEPASPGSSMNMDIKKLNKLLDIYKNKFSQLKEAYAESELEKEKIKVQFHLNMI